MILRSLLIVATPYHTHISSMRLSSMCHTHISSMSHGCDKSRDSWHDSCTPMHLFYVVCVWHAWDVHLHGGTWVMDEICVSHMHEICHTWMSHVTHVCRTHVSHAQKFSKTSIMIILYGKFSGTLTFENFYVDERQWGGERIRFEVGCFQIIVPSSDSPYTILFCVCATWLI